MYIIYKKFCFAHVILIVNQASLGKNPAILEGVVSTFSENCNFNNSFSFYNYMRNF